MPARTGLCLGLVLTTLLAGTALADGDPAQLPDPDTQSARRHFDRGASLYDQAHYGAAVREFEAAKRVKPLAAFEFNIARCRDRLEEWSAAADGYERYLAAVPNAPEAAELRSRIAELRARVGGLVVATPPGSPRAIEDSPSIVGRWWFWTALGAVVVASLAIGIAASSGGQHAAIPTTADGNFGVTFP